jgi:predicted MFS family arabinose efflux permease
MMAAIAFLVFFNNAMFPALLPELANEFQVGPLDFKWLVPGFALAYAVATLIYGVVSDLHGRPLVLKRLLCFAAIAIPVLSLSKTAQHLVLLRSLSGLAVGGIATISLSIIGDKYPYPVQGRPMGKMFGAVAAGMGLGVSLGPMLSALIGWRWAIRLVSAGFVIAAGWVHKQYSNSPTTTFVPKPVYKILDEYLCVLWAPRGKRTLAFITANGIFHGGVFAWLGLFLAIHFQLGQVGIGLTLIGYGVPDLILGAFIGGWADRYGRRFVVPGGFFWAATCACAIAVSRMQWMAGLSIAALSIGFDATYPMMSSITTSLDPKHRGQLTGMATFANFIGMSIGALIFRDLLRWGFPQAFSAFAGLESLFGVAAVFCFRTEKPPSYI